jgi:iron complex outermembrane recepter protein
MRYGRLYTGVAFSALFLGAGLAPSGAQTVAQGSSISGLETVIVTARKRAENAQQVPISITALNQDELTKLNVLTIQDLKTVSPSVYVQPTAFRQDTLNVTIRGQRNFDSPSGGGNPGLAFDTASAVYKDGVYYARAVGLGGSLFDIDSLEVLKGPQGTLVGRNTTGGAILYTTRQPGDTFGGYVTGTLGDYGRAGLQGAVDLPLSDTLFARVALNMDDQRGYVSNHYSDPVSGASNTQPAFGSDRLGGLFSLKWQPDDSFDILFRADIAAEHDTGSTYHDLNEFIGTTKSLGRASVCNIPAACSGFTDLLGHPVAPTFLTFNANTASNPNPSPAAHNSVLNSLAREQTYGFWSTEQAGSDVDVGHYQTYSAIANKSLGDTNVKLMAAYRTWDSTGTAVSRGQPFATNIYRYDTPNYQSWQSELTVNGSAIDDRLKWTAGLFYFTEQSPNDGGTLFLFSTNAGSAPSPSKQITVTDWSKNSEENSSYAAYAQATYSIWPDTRFTAGVRYTYDERSADINSQTILTPATQATTNALVAAGKPAVFNSTPFVINGISYSGQSDLCFLTDASGHILPEAGCGADIAKSYHKPTYTLALDHDLWEGTMVYATMRSGYRSGGINTQSINIGAITALPEEVQDYEVGGKSDFLLAGIPVRADLALYQTAYHNIQVQEMVPNVTVATATGGGPCTQAALNANQCINNFNDNITLNAKKARIYGAEWDVTVLPTDWLTLNTSGSYIDPWYTDFTFVAPAGYLQPTNANLSGTPIPVPRWQTNETATVNFGDPDIGFPLGDTLFTAHYYWQSRYLADLRGFDPSQRTFAYGMLNVRLDFTDVGKSGMDLGLFMNNVANTQACLPEYNGTLNSVPNPTFGTPGTSGVTQCIPLPPRMTGMQATYRF